QLLGGIVGHLLDARDATDRKQDDVPRSNAEPPSHEDVAIFVREHAGEDRDDESHGSESRRGATLSAGHQPEPGEQQEERQVDADFGPRNSTERYRPAHHAPRGPSKSVARRWNLAEAVGSCDRRLWH